MRNSLFSGTGLKKSYGSLFIKAIIILLLLRYGMIVLFYENLSAGISAKTSLCETLLYHSYNLLRTTVKFLPLIMTIATGIRLFTKAGISPWKMLIPYYNLYCVFVILEDKGYFVLTYTLIQFIAVFIRYFYVSRTVTLLLVIAEITLTLVLCIQYILFASNIVNRLRKDARAIHCFLMLIFPLIFIFAGIWNGESLTMYSEDKGVKRRRRSNFIVTFILMAVVLAVEIYACVYVSHLAGANITAILDAVKSHICSDFELVGIISIVKQI